MKNTVMTRLILKDIYLNRTLIIGSLVAAFISLLIATLSPTSFTVGSLAFITTMVAMGVCIPLYGVVRERDNKSWLFVLSLPLSPTQYYQTKVASALIAFLLPWSLSLLAAVVLIKALAGLPDGLLPAFVLLMLFFLHNFAILLAVALLTRSEALNGAAIVITNTSITLFMFFIFSLPSIDEHMEGPVAVWSPAVFAVMLYEVLVTILVLCLALFQQSRRQDLL